MYGAYRIKTDLKNIYEELAWESVQKGIHPTWGNLNVKNYRRRHDPDGPPRVPVNSLTLKTPTPTWMALLKTHRSKQF